MKKFSFVSGFIYNTEDNSNYSFGVYTELNHFGTITLKECQDINNKLKEKLLKENQYLKSFKIDLSDYIEYNQNGTPVLSSEENPFARKGSQKEARYSIEHNRLRIYKDGLPVYENNDGIICNDEVALCDSLC